MSNDSPGNTDVAALAASAVAAAISLSVAPGPYDVFSLVTGITLSAVLLAYVWPHARDDRLRSFAVASSLALAMLPLFGFLDEAFRELILDQPLGKTWDGAPDSRVGGWDIFVLWIVAAAVLYWRDAPPTARQTGEAS
jgi:hypothetical protein